MPLLADLLRARLDPLTARLRGPEIDALAARLRGNTLLEALGALPDVLADLRREHTALLTSLAALTAEVEAAATPAARRDGLARAIRAGVADPVRRRGDLRALRRWLDLDALAERNADARDRLEVQVELALRLAAAALADPASARGPIAALGTCLLGQLTWLPRFPLRLACLDALTRLVLAERSGLGGEGLAAAAAARLDDPGEHPWVQVAAARLLAQVAPEDALVALSERLLRPRSGRRDFLARRLFVAALAERVAPDAPAARAQLRAAPRPPGSLALEPLGWRDAPLPIEPARQLLLAVGAASDPSEHLRIGLTYALAALADDAPRARELLRRAADPARETSPRVRAHAARAAARLPPADAAALLTAGLRDDPSELVLRVACSELEVLAAALIDAARAPAWTPPRDLDDPPPRDLDDPPPRDLDDRPPAVAVPRPATVPRIHVTWTEPPDRPKTRPPRTPPPATPPPAPPPTPPPALPNTVADALAAADVRLDMSARIGFPIPPEVAALVGRGGTHAADLSAAPDPVTLDQSARISRVDLDGILDREPPAAPAPPPSTLIEDVSVDPSGSYEIGVDGLEVDLEDEPSGLPPREHLAALARELARLTRRDDRPPVVQEAAAAALEALDRAGDPRRRAWTPALRQALAAIRPGARARVGLRRPELPPRGDERWLGRILADLARDDWGLDVDVREDSLIVRRGDRFRTRLWRVLHELRHPGPGKRQAHSHTRGRALRGGLRAHSGRLHEVTATGVPGERVHCEQEGGWGRHLPLVDDLLGLPLLRPRPVRIVSSQGVAELRWRVPLARRLLARLRLTFGYARYAELRRQALAEREPEARGRYVRALRERLGVDVTFEPHPPPRLGPADALRDPPLRGAPTLPPQLAALFASGPLDLGVALALLLPDLLEQLRLRGAYFFSLAGNNQQALVYFLAGLAGLFLVAAYVRRRAIARDRAAIPLVIGGWGTRGKSGTERLKAGLFQGLGYRVFAKTTGCEAIFIHAGPHAPALEIYTFRPYGKATIWEQRTLLNLAARLQSDVFLWECMALSPAYVDILQHVWTRDDLSTITNCYPDHEDIQGPAGMDVAEVIARFVPTRATAVSSEVNFAPILREAARARGSELVEVDPFAGDLLPRDLLDLFPYDEHPRNVALVARMAAHLGLDPELALVTAAEHVVPDLGVLRRYGPARLRGRVLTFINGCSANERTGFLSNWRRTACDAYDLAARPDEYLITVVNNRDDRVARSQVFARVLVEDTAVDRHLIIGTNTRGLVGFVEGALGEFLAAQEIAGPDDRAAGPAGLARAERRLDALLARLRLPPPEPAALADQLDLYAAAAHLDLAAQRPELLARCAPLLAPDPAAPVLLSELLAEVDAALGTWLSEQLARAAPRRPADDPAAPELLGPADPAEVRAHFVRQLARAAAGARLRARLRAAFAAEGALPRFHDELRAAYAALFRELLDVVEDPHATGDQVVLRCALAVPPGVRVALMGTQNIKGTGLDFVYRWIALDAAQQALLLAADPDPARRAEGLQRLARPHDPGLLDAGLVADALARRSAGSDDAEHHARALAGARDTLAARRAALARRAAPRRFQGLWTWLELWVDFLDGARRYFVARRVMRDLVDRRISHVRAAHEMRELDARAKGGWLARSLRA